MDFENIKNKVTKKHIIIGTSALVTIAAGTTVGIVACNSDTNDTKQSVSTQAQGEVYTLEIDSSTGVSALDLYKELLSDHSDLGILSSDSNATVITLSNVSTAVDVSFSDGKTEKDFLTAGDFTETLVVHDKSTGGVLELSIKLTVKKAAVTTAVTTTTAKTTTTVSTTTTAVSTTKKPKKTEKKEDKSDSNKTEVANDSTYEEDYNDYSYDEPQYEAPSQQETPKQEEPKYEEPAPEPEPIYDTNSPEYFGLSGQYADWFRYAISQGCDGWQADSYVYACDNYGAGSVIIGNPCPDNPDSYWSIWIDLGDGTYQSY